MAEGKRTVKTAAIFSLMVFGIMVTTMMLAMLFTSLLFYVGLLNKQRIGFVPLVFPVTCIVMGTILSKFAGKRPIGIIVALSEATKEVAQGNFDIKLNENIPAVELRTVAQNFNAMIRELSHTEMLRSDFIENVSHEFKTPLSAIEGYTTLLQKKGLSEEKRQEYIRRILFNTKRLTTLTGNILLLSRLEHQEIEIKKESYSLDEQLREIILTQEPQWAKKDLTLDIDLDSADVYGNRDLLAQVWQNLLDNAIKFAPDGGSIQVLLYRKPEGVEVSVADNGIGMSQEVLGRVYEKFYQGDTSRASSGNGLGLALVKRIVDLHGGTITAASKENEGAVFSVTLRQDI